MLNQEESRQFNRMDVFCAIDYKFPDAEESYVGECLNISGSGILFRGKHRLERGMALELAIATRNDLTTPLRAYVEVISSKEVESEQYEVATEIKGIREY
ncbi:PilZ domain-containing protein [Methyloprofundus sp.]|uniref:PilZ domain-containing protein n=1 Tax=Methyloprofundus sp. TaxID=2020875 RepID=UPI003D0C13F3